MSLESSGDRPRGCLSMVALVVLPAIVIPLLLFLLIFAHLFNWFPRREDPVPDSADLEWHGGRVVVWDYCTFPGAYDIEVAWFGPSARKVVLADFGDNKGQRLFVNDRKLHIVYGDRTSTGARAVMVFEAPERRLKDVILGQVDLEAFGHRTTAEELQRNHISEPNNWK